MRKDENVESVRSKLAARAKIGLRKYGVTTERGDISTLDWLRHAQEEAMDLAVYLERLIRDEEKRLDDRIDDLLADSPAVQRFLKAESQK